jgi:DNA primase
MRNSNSLLCKQANQIDLVDYLATLGHHSQKTRGNDYWYLSPLRSEHTASFKVDRKLNLWYDHGTGKGGTLVDFGIAYFNCTIKDLLLRLKDSRALSVTFQPQVSIPAVEKKNAGNTYSKSPPAKNSGVSRD